MDEKLPQIVLVGSRAGSGLGFVLTAPAAIIALAFGACVVRQEVGSGLVSAAAGLFLLAYSLDYLVRSIRPNVLRLDDEGFALKTWHSTRQWRWFEYRGVWGLGHQMLRVSRDGVLRNVLVGNWSQDLEYCLYTYASVRGADIPKPEHKRPSAAPMLALSGVLMAVVFLVAWLDFSR